MGGDLHIVSPSLPSTPRKVLSGHRTKSSILYLHSPGVRPKVTVRPSGHPLIQDSLSRFLQVESVGVLGTGVPRLACLRPAVWLKRGPSTAHLHQHRPETLARGQASRGGRQGASSGTASSGWLTRRQRVQGRVPREVPMTQAMTTKGARRAPARTVSSFPLWCKGSKQRQEHQAKAPVSVQQDQDQSNGRMEVTVEPKSASPPEPLTSEDQL